METIEIQAPTLDEAKAQAAAKLGVDVKNIEVKILEEQKGLFGKSSVRVEAKAKAAKPAKEAKAEKPAKAAAPVKEEAPAKPRRGAKPAPLEEEAPAAEEAPAPAAVAEKPARGRRGKPEKAAATPAEPGQEEEEGGEDVQATDEDAKELLTIVKEILHLAHLEGSVEIEGLSGRYVNMKLDGQDVAYLVGKHGEVLNSLQYLMNVISGRQLGNGVRVTLDGNDYRHRREDALGKLATQIAEQVKARGEEAVLDALPAFERRVVHKALSEFSGVTTYSEGEEPNRRVVIAPG